MVSRPKPSSPSSWLRFRFGVDVTESAILFFDRRGLD